uniref:Uncharacterized protein n=1 Tax=Anopheles farauti TaxID=69004 RepID=A0A182Q4A3_9DIPT
MNDKSYFERSASVGASDDIGRRIASAAGVGGVGATGERLKLSAGGSGLTAGASKIGESRRKSASFDVDRHREPEAAGATSGATGGPGGDAGIRRRSSSNSSVHRRSQAKVTKEYIFD